MTSFISRHGLLIHILAAILIASMMFIAVQPGIVRAFASEESFSLKVASEGVPVDTLVDAEGFRQIKYTFEGREVEITDSSYTNSDPQNDGEYITWMAQIEGNWQVFLHQVTAGTTIQLTQVGNNVNPVISGKNVAWEGQVDGVWQIFLFDGVKISQITFGTQPSVDAAIAENVLVYSTKSSDGLGWKIYMFNLDTKVETLLTPNTYGSTPTISNGRVKWTEIVDKEPVDKFFQYIEKPGYVRVVEEEVIVPEEVEESTESQEEVLGVEDIKPKEVTVEDIKEELGILDDTGEEEAVESSQSN